jgi:hypothetical protein
MSITKLLLILLLLGHGYPNNQSNCPAVSRAFIPEDSLTYTTDGTRKDLNFGSGTVSGVISQDYLRFENFTDAQLVNFILVDKCTNLKASNFDGVLGLTPVNYDGADSIIDILKFHKRA